MWGDRTIAALFCSNLVKFFRGGKPAKKRMMQSYFYATHLATGNSGRSTKKTHRELPFNLNGYALAATARGQRLNLFCVCASDYILSKIAH